MRLLIVSQYFWPEDFRINELVRDFSEKGHELTILTGVPNYPEGKIFPEYKKNKKAFIKFGTCRIIRIPAFPRGSNKLSLFLNYLSFVVLGSLYGLFYSSKIKFDLIFVFEPSPIFVCIPAILLKWLKKKPITLWVLDLWPQTLSAVGIFKKKSIFIRFIGLIVRFIYRNCDLILGQSRSFVKEIRKFSDSPEKVKYFPNWYENIYSQSNYSLAEEIEIKDDTFKIMFAGNIGEAQDFPTILRAMKAIKGSNISLYLIGDGRKSGWVRDNIRALNLQSSIKVLGRFPSARMPEFFLHADALLVSLKPDEIFDKTIPGKLQSYLASKKPVIGVLNGEGKKVILESECGKVVTPGNHLGLAKAIEEMNSMPKSELLLMGENGFNYAKENFEKEKLYKDLQKWMSDILIMS